MKELLLVFLGGGLGSTVRFSLGKWVNALHNHHFPWGTLVVNIVACFILGFVIGLADHKHLISASSRLFWTVGFCGGFSTFSAFSNETLYLIQAGFTISLILYISLSLLLCVAAIFGGLYIGEHV
jgi:CrcB protein